MTRGGVPGRPGTRPGASGVTGFAAPDIDDGATFSIQAPDAFTQEQVVEMAEQVTYHP